MDDKTNPYLSRLLPPKPRPGSGSTPASASPPESRDATGSSGDEYPPPYGYQALDLAKKSGERWGFPYAALASQHFASGNTSIVLRFTFHLVTIKGRSLETVYQRLLKRAVELLEETPTNPANFAEGGQAVIEMIDVQDAV